MIEQSGNAIYFYAFFTASGLGATGLTVTVDVYRNRSEIVTAASASEMGDGVYYYQLASGSNNAEGEYIAIFKTAGTADQKHIPAIWVVDKAGVENLNDPIGDKLDAASYTAPPTVAAIRTEIDSNSTKLDVAVSTRLATAGYTTPPTAVQNRQEMDSNSTQLAAIKTKTDGLNFTGTDVKATLDSETVVLTTPAPTAAAIADAVLDELLSEHVIAGSAGGALADAGSAADPLSNEVPGSYAEGTAGAKLGLITSGDITIVNPLDTQENLISIVQGSDQTGANAIEFNGDWNVTLSSGTVEFRYRDTVNPPQAIQTIACTVSGGVTPVLSMSSAVTAALEFGSERYVYQLWHINGAVKTCLVRGKVSVTEELA